MYMHHESNTKLIRTHEKPSNQTSILTIRPPGQYKPTISDQEFETFWPLAKFYHTCYTLGLQIWYSCEYISHEHEYIFYFFIVQSWKLTEAFQSSKVIVSGDWNGRHIKVTVNCQILIGWMLLTSTFSVHIQSAQNNACHAQQTKN